MPTSVRLRQGPVLGAIAVLLGLVSAVGAVGATRTALERTLLAPAANEELIYLPPTRFLRAVSLGYRRALADVLWFRAISYFGRHYRGDGVYPWLAHLCDAVTDLDPWAEHAYSFGGVILPWEASQVDAGIALLEKGVRNMPDAWRLQYLLGFNYYFFKGDLAAASRVLGAAAHTPGAPDFLGPLAATIQATHAGPDTAIAFLDELERKDPGAPTAAVVRQRRLELTLTRDIDALTQALAEFARRYQRPAQRLDELVASGLVPGVPVEPFGGQYILEPTTGAVGTTSGHKPARMGSSAMRERTLQGSRQD